MKLIYDMPEEEYHALERLSASGIKKLLTSAQDFWVTSWMNKDKEDTTSDVFNTGKAYHARILEGADVFNSRYAIAPDVDRRTKAGKEAYAKWQEEHPGALNIDEKTATYINAAKAIDLDYFKDGKPEVTVLWEDEETGVPMKSRYDYLKTGQINDLKTFSNTTGMDIKRLLATHIVKYRYHVQAAVYKSQMPDHEFNFVFQQAGAVNNCVAINFSSNLLLAQKGNELMRQGINKFAQMYRRYGVSPWYDDYKVITLRDEDFPMYVYED